MDSFIFFGHFYQLMIDQEVHSCRSTLEIVRLCNDNTAPAWAQEPNNLLDHQPDAVFVMLNPGGSRPCDGRQTISRVSDPHQIAEDARSNLILTCPDETQRAIEIVMSRKQLNHARVLNLLDIRNTQSEDINKMIRSQPEDALPYSIFSPQRQVELIGRLGRCNQIVVVAWGVKENCADFFKKCHRTLENNQRRPRIIGWKHKNRPQRKRLFYHPTRRRKKWPCKISKMWP